MFTRRIQMADNKALWDEAESLRGCLENLKTHYSRRRTQHTEAGDAFVNDEAAILESKAWRTLAHKTQVFTEPDSPLVRTRQAHVLEVTASSVKTAQSLGLNTNLIRAASLGHDLGHVPFGHQGEDWMKKTMGRPDFCHEKMGPIVMQKIERRGHGLNLTHEVLESGMCHTGDMTHDDMPPEAWVLRYTDKFAYIFHDINDIGNRAGYPLSAEIWKIANSFGDKQRHRELTARSALVVESAAIGKVSFEHSEHAKQFKRLRDLMYEVYVRVTQQDVNMFMEPTLEFLAQLKLADPFMLLAIMTDTDTLKVAQSPKDMRDMNLFNQTALCEIKPYLEEIGTVDLCDPDLDW